MQDKSPSKPNSFIRRHKVALIILIPIAVLLLLAYGIPVLVGDGTGRFSGTEKVAAKQALRDAYQSLDPMHKIDIPPVIYYIEDVHKMNPEQVSRYCQYESQRAPKAKFYYVDISIITYFGVRIDRSTNQNDCINIQ